MKEWLEWFAKIGGAITLAATLLGYGGKFRDWLAHRADREAMIVQIARLKSGTEAERTKAFDTLSYVTARVPSLLDSVYPQVVAFIGVKAQRAKTMLCGTNAAFRDAERVQAAPDVKGALAFLREHRRPSLGPLGPLRQVNLSKVDLSKADLRRAVFDDACLDGAALDGAVVDSARFINSSLRTATMRGVRGVDVVFNNSRLDSARFDGAALPRSSFVNASLVYGWFEAAKLEGADFSGAKLAWSNWRSATLTDAQRWDEVDSARIVGALLSGATGVPARALEFLRRFGACVDPIDYSDWDTRLTTPAARDTTCGLPRRKHGRGAP